MNTKGLSERLDAATAGLRRGPFFALSSYNGPGPREKPLPRAQKTPRESDSPPGPPADEQRAFLASRFPSRWAMGFHSQCTLLALGPNSVFQGKRGRQKIMRKGVGVKILAELPNGQAAGMAFVWVSAAQPRLADTGAG